MVCALNVHGHAHRRCVCNERMRRVVGGNNNARANGLLSKVIVKNPLLDALHNLTAKKTNHSQIHTGIHQPERIPGGDDTIKRRQIFKSAANNLNFGMRPELPPKGITEFYPSIYENQAHGEGT